LARPKGIAIDSDDHVYVVDNLFDNFQIFDEEGTALLAVGSAGQAPGEFWSPAGIDIVADTLFVADTYNNRIQMFRYLGGTP
jgi:DNA-binding beta-propeller fold protein YncE